MKTRHESIDKLCWNQGCQSWKRPFPAGCAANK